jgi:hypothetical protein
MSLGEKITDAIPAPVMSYFNEHPRALCVVTGAMVVLSIALMLTADELDVRANQFRRMRLGEMQRAASEALGG